MDSFFFEKDLMERFQRGVGSALRAILDTAAFVDSALEARATLWGAVVRAMVFGTKALQTMAIWAGGDLLPPNQVISSLR